MCAHSRCGSGIILNDPRRRKILEGSGVRAPLGNFFGFLLLKSPFLGFQVIQTGLLARFQRRKCSYYKKYIIMTEMSPISVKRWKPVWIRDRILSLNVTGVACS